MKKGSSRGYYIPRPSVGKLVDFSLYGVEYRGKIVKAVYGVYTVEYEKGSDKLEVLLERNDFSIVTDTKSESYKKYTEQARKRVEFYENVNNLKK